MLWQEQCPGSPYPQKTAAPVTQWSLPMKRHYSLKGGKKQWATTFLEAGGILLQCLVSKSIQSCLARKIWSDHCKNTRPLQPLSPDKNLSFLHSFKNNQSFCSWLSNQMKTAFKPFILVLLKSHIYYHLTKISFFLNHHEYVSLSLGSTECGQRAKRL